MCGWLITLPWWVGECGLADVGKHRAQTGHRSTEQVSRPGESAEISWVGGHGLVSQGSESIPVMIRRRAWGRCQEVGHSPKTQTLREMRPRNYSSRDAGKYVAEYGTRGFCPVLPSWPLLMFGTGRIGSIWNSGVDRWEKRIQNIRN